MVEVAERAAQAGRRLRDDLARLRLTRDLARLYSQHIRLRTGQDPLRSFTDSEATLRLGDAVRLVEASFAGRDRGDDGWRLSLRRAGEVLEWLAHPETNTEGLPLTLLGAACYQLAGYPARAASLASQGGEEQEAPLLRSLLRSDYQGLLDIAPELARDHAMSERVAEGWGAVWTWTVIDADTKLVPCWYVGGRTATDAMEFMQDVASRLDNRVQLTTDGLNS